MCTSTGITTAQFNKWLNDGKDFSYERFEQSKIESFDLVIEKARKDRQDRIQLQPLTQALLDEGFRFANRKGYSDCDPYEIISISKSGKTATIRPMDADLVTPAECLGVGGFAAHFDNHSQEWEITSNEAYPTKKIRLTKKGWAANGTRYRIQQKPVKFYDYNF